MPLHIIQVAVGKFSNLFASRKGTVTPRATAEVAAFGVEAYLALATERRVARIPVFPRRTL
jgi:hypothetical protein